MEILYFKDYEEIQEYMIRKAEKGKDVTAVLFVRDAIELMKELMMCTYIEIGGINIAQTEYNGYYKEYYVTLSHDFVLDIEPAWTGKRYLYTEPDIMLIDADANSKIIKDIPSYKCREIYIGDDNFDEYDESEDAMLDNVKVITDDNGSPAGMAFTDLETLVKYLHTLF